MDEADEAEVDEAEVDEADVKMGVVRCRRDPLLPTLFTESLCRVRVTAACRRANRSSAIDGDRGDSGGADGERGGVVGGIAGALTMALALLLLPPPMRR